MNQLRPVRRPRLLFLVTEDWYFCSHRLSMARMARDLGWEVVVATHLDRHEAAISAEGFRPVHLPSLRRWRGLFGEWAKIRGLIDLYKAEAPDLTHHIALVPALYGSLAAALAGVPRVINTLTGLGFFFISNERAARGARWMLVRALRLLLSRRGRVVVFQNQDDRALFLSLGVVPPDRALLIPGSGVDTDRFHTIPEPPAPVTAAFVGRLLRDKGVAEIAEAARLLKRRGVPVRILLVGDRDPSNPNCLAEELIRGWEAEGILEWAGFSTDIFGLWQRAHIALLPSYREGLPKSLLEAAACGRPMIAADVPGCREVVKDGLTGLLVPVRNGGALADSIQRLVEDRGLRHSLGQAARKRVEALFSDRVITAQMRELYQEVMAR